MISASKSTLSLNNLNILRPKVTKNLMNLRKKFCKSPLIGILQIQYDCKRNSNKFKPTKGKLNLYLETELNPS